MCRTTSSHSPAKPNHRASGNEDDPRHFAKLCDRAGVRRIRFHDLRHSCATLLYEQGVPLENIQDVLGHSSPTVTKMIYIEVTKRVQREAVDRLDYLFSDSDDEDDDGPAATGVRR